MLHMWTLFSSDVSSPMDRVAVMLINWILHSVLAVVVLGRGPYCAACLLGHGYWVSYGKLLYFHYYELTIHLVNVAGVNRLFYLFEFYSEEYCSAPVFLAEYTLALQLQPAGGITITSAFPLPLLMFRHPVLPCVLPSSISIRTA